MTDKQTRLLDAALELFANDGYNATSTSKVAKAAGVSEGLIFRHFGNKRGLLDALMAEAERKLATVLAPVLFATDPEATIGKAVELPFAIDPGEYDFWRLQYKLKWEKGYHHPQKMKPLLDKLCWAFSELGYSHPEQEAQLLSQVLEAVATEILRAGNPEEWRPYRTFLRWKYLG
ncbi:MAG: TetR/AcrR family transcriptional regulator [Saprospiraceae bacterium]|nr:TetR/AcrR family transcriptional regulator [Saprospiraceae bacterium]MCB0622829.1 TetR/AcrR family transcriptional regulator [Saprospiraceae bacterium]